MALLNDNFLKLKAGYLFPEISRRVKVFCEANPEAAKRLIRCGIGDVTEPLPPAAIAAMHKAVDEMAARETFQGYGPEQGYEWLRAAIAKNDFRDRGCDVADDEIFVSDGAKCDTGNILDILGAKNKIAISDPVYPVYVDTNVMAGHTRRGERSRHLREARLSAVQAVQRFHSRTAEAARGRDLSLLAEQPDRRGGQSSATRSVGEIRARTQSRHFVRRRLRGLHQRRQPAAFDLRNSRRARVRHRIPQFLEERRVHRHALRVHGRSQNPAGAPTKSGEMQPLHPLWLRRMTTKFNGVSYIVQRGAEALYSPEGKAQVRALIEHYLGNAKVLREGAKQAGLKVFGGVNAPYIWAKAPKGVTSWQAFDKILGEANVVITPGSGFGSKGEGYFRISAFNSRANAEEVARRLQALKW